MRSLGAAIAAAMLTTVLAGCGGHEVTPRPAPHSSARSTSPASPIVTPAVEVWRADHGIPISPVVSTDGHIGVYYAARKGKLVIVGLDLATGHELWSRPGPADPPVDARPAPLASGAVAVVLGKGSETAAAGIDPHTGATLWETTSARTMSRYWWCTADRKRLCVSLDGKRWAIDATGTAHPDADEDGVSADFAKGTISLVEGGRKAWTITMDDLRKGWTVRTTYNTVRAGRILLTMTRDTKKPTLRPSEVATAALDAADGRLVWIRTAEELCPLTLPDDRIWAPTEQPRYDTLCHYRGGTMVNLWTSMGGRDHTTATDYVGVDLASGKEIWRRFAGTGRHEDGPPSADGTAAYIDLQVGDELVDMRTGKGRPVPDDYVAWVSQDYAVTDSVDPRVAARSLQRSGHFEPRRQGSTAHQLYWPLPEYLGVVAGDIHALMTDDAIVGYRAGAPTRFTDE